MQGIKIFKLPALDVMTLLLEGAKLLMEAAELLLEAVIVLLGREAVLLEKGVVVLEIAVVLLARGMLLVEEIVLFLEVETSCSGKKYTHAFMLSFISHTGLLVDGPSMVTFNLFYTLRIGT